MATNRSTILDNPPSASPSSEESESEELSEQPLNHNPPEPEQESDNETSDEEEEDDEEGKLAPPLSNDDDVSGSDDDPGSPASPTASDFIVKPIVSKPMNNSPKPKKSSQNSKPSPSEAVPEKVDSKSEGQTNGKPLNNGGGSVDQKKPLITRIWDEDSEISILKGFHKYRTKKGLDPYANTVTFHEFMQKMLNFEVTKNQLMDKIRRLKKKFENNSKKGKGPHFSKPHEHKMFELSKKIWGESLAIVEGNGKIEKRKEESVSKESSVVDNKSNKKVKRDLVMEDEKQVVVEKGLGGEGLKVDVAGFWGKYPRLKEALEFENSGLFSEEGMTAMQFDFSKIGDAECKVIEGKWKMFQAKEVELKILKSDLVKQQTQMILDAFMKP